MATLKEGQQSILARIGYWIAPCLYQESVQTRKENQSQEHNSSRLGGYRDKGVNGGQK